MSVYGDQDLRDAPDVRQLWDRTHTARKGGRTCQWCKREVRAGQKYQSTGYRIDGVFEEWFRHYGAERMDDCPK